MAIARAAVLRCGLAECINERRGNGLAQLRPGEAATVDIAGWAGGRCGVSVACP